MEKDSYYYYNLGKECFQKKEISNAIKYFLQSLDKDYHFKTYHMLYECYNLSGEVDLANYFIKMSYESNSNNDKVSYLYSMTLINRNDISKAKEILLDILNRNPTYKKAKEEYNRICAI